MTTAPAATAAPALPTPAAWSAAARRHGELFGALDPGARVALVARSAPTTMLLWEAGATGIESRAEAFAGHAASGADITLAADDHALAAIACALDGASGATLFETLRAGIREGHIVCFVLRRRCQLEERGFEELLDALGYAFMGACR